MCFVVSQFATNNNTYNKTYGTDQLDCRNRVWYIESIKSRTTLLAQQITPVLSAQLTFVLIFSVCVCACASHVFDVLYGLCLRVPVQR